MTGHSRKPSTRRAEEDRSQHKRTRSDRGNTRTIEVTGGNRNAPRTPSPSAGAKRTSTDVQGNNDDKSEQIDSRAIYDTNKEEIDDWYDLDYTRKQGIGPFGKMLRSKHRWYQKVAAWMKYKGMGRSPKKKRKLNDGSPVSGEVKDTRPLRPHQRKYPGDLVAVPEYPFDNLEEYTPMENGRYACSHVHLEPPKQCCTLGLSKEAKRQAIKKDLLLWKGRVEKLIDKRQLDRQHMTWTNWTVPELRKKHQRALWDQQDEKKQADIARKRREAEQQRMRQQHFANLRASQSTDQRGVKQHRPIYQTVPERGFEKQPVTPPTAAGANPISPPASPQPSPVQMQRPIAPMRRRKDPSAVASAQAGFLTNVARRKPRLLRSYEALYHDAQYRENLKDLPDFVLLRKWYLAYFLKQQRQPLSAEQRTLLESGDPSHDGKKRFGDARPIERVDELFGEYLSAAKREKETQRFQQQSETSLAVEEQAVRRGSPTLGLPSTMPTRCVESPAQADAYNCEELFEDIEVTPTGTPMFEPVSHAPFEDWDYNRLDSELDRILGTRSGYAERFVVQTVESPPQETTMLRNEVSYLATLLPAFATGNPAVDDGMQKLLEYAYQTGSTSQQHASEDECLLHRIIEESRSDWQRCCDFFSAEGPAHINPIEER